MMMRDVVLTRGGMSGRGVREYELRRMRPLKLSLVPGITIALAAKLPERHARCASNERCLAGRHFHDGGSARRCRVLLDRFRVCLV